jgi:hypothetical protein
MFSRIFASSHRHVFSFFSLISFSFIFISTFRPSTAFQCTDNNIECPGICCNFRDPYLLLTGPTCNFQAFWYSTENGTVWPFPTFRFHWGSNGSVIGTPESKPAAKDTTEVLTMHPSWDSHANEENNSGVFFSLFNVNVSCIFSTFIFCFCIAILVLLAYLGYRRFCARPRRKSTSRPATSRSAPLKSHFSTLEDKFEMEDYDGSATY